VSKLKAAIYELPKRLDCCVNANGDRFYDLMKNNSEANLEYQEENNITNNNNDSENPNSTPNKSSPIIK